MPQQELEKTDKLLVEQFVNECVERHRSRFLTTIGALVALFGVISGAVLWTVQNSGTSVATEAVKTTMQEYRVSLKEIETNRIKLQTLVGDTESKADKIKGFFTFASNTHRAAADLEPKIQEAEKTLVKAGRQLDAAQNTFDDELNAVAKRVANEPTFREALIQSVDARLVQIQQSVKSLSDARRTGFAVGADTGSNVIIGALPTQPREVCEVQVETRGGPVWVGLVAASRKTFASRASFMVLHGQTNVYSHVRIMRDGDVEVANYRFETPTSEAYLSLPPSGIQALDANVPAGIHKYSLEVNNGSPTAAAGNSLTLHRVALAAVEVPISPKGRRRTVD